MTFEELAKLAGLGSEWQAIDSAPIRPGQGIGGAPPSPNAMGTYFQGSISPNLQHDAYFVGTQYGTPTVPTVALMPVGASGNAGINSGVLSAVSTANSSKPKPTPTPAPAPGQLFEFNGDAATLGTINFINGIPI